MQLNGSTVLKMLEMIIGVIIVCLHFLSDVGSHYIVLICSTGFVSPMIVQMFRLESSFYKLSELDKTADIFIIVYCMGMYLTASILTIVEARDIYLGLFGDDHIAIVKGAIGLLIVILLLVDMILSIRK